MISFYSVSKQAGFNAEILRGIVTSSYAIAAFRIHLGDSRRHIQDRR